MFCLALPFLGTFLCGILLDCGELDPIYPHYQAYSLARFNAMGTGRKTRSVRQRGNIDQEMLHKTGIEELGIISIEREPSGFCHSRKG